jgi:hypothetical protein
MCATSSNGVANAIRSPVGVEKGFLIFLVHLKEIVRCGFCERAAEPEDVLVHRARINLKRASAQLEHMANTVHCNV